MTTTTNTKEQETTTLLKESKIPHLQTQWLLYTKLGTLQDDDGCGKMPSKLTRKD